MGKLSLLILPKSENFLSEKSFFMWADFLSPFFSLHENRFIYGWFFSLQFVFGTCTYDYLACIKLGCPFSSTSIERYTNRCKKWLGNKSEACWESLLVASSARQAILCLARLVWLEKLKFVEVCTPMDHWTALNCKVCRNVIVPACSRRLRSHIKIFWGKAEFA